MPHPTNGRPPHEAAPVPLLPDRAYERIRHDIITCSIGPGSEIPEAQLCAHYRLGHAAVRLALNRLAREGLVCAIPRRGYRVARISLKDIHDVFELRQMLEPAAARMAAGRMDAQQLRLLDEIACAAYQPGDAKSTARFLDANRKIHVTVARAAGNARLAGAVERLLEEMARLLHLGLGLRDRSREMARENRTLLKALARGDGDAAERISREQIEAARSMVLSAVLTSPLVMDVAHGADASP